VKEDPRADARGDERRAVAGLELQWREFRAPDATGDDGGDRADARFGIWVLADPDVLLDQITEAEYYAHDERMPYFGAIWPAAESLIAKVLRGPRLVERTGGDERPLEVLDLGCGLGPCGFAAARRGARVTFLDWEPRALAICEESARRQDLPPDRFRFVAADWRTPPPIGPFDRILGADVLYEERNAPAIAAFLTAHLKVGAEAWITDPNRPHARRFPHLAHGQGLAFVASEILPPMAHRIDVTLLRMLRPGIVDSRASR